MKIRLPKALAALLLGGAVLVAGVCVVSTVRASDQTHSKSKNLGLVVDNSALDRDVKGVNASYSAIVKKVSPCVVTIKSTIVEKRAAMPNMPNDPFFQRFFGGNLNHPQKEHGVGSGVIVSKDGYILTNNHVVDDAENVQVELQDGRNFVAKVVGKDPKSDLAVVKIDAHDLPVVTIADSDKAEVGDVVLALGNPFDVGPSVTMGIISATGRTSLGVEGENGYEDFIQTDAAINPGNSGGALIDTEGRLIGINTAIFSRSGGNQGVGFAIPSSLAREVMLSLVDYGKVTRGYLGVGIQSLTPDLAREFKIKGNHGALVGEVMPNSPADKAGLKSGDVIVEFNNKPVIDSPRLRLEVSRMAPGQKVPLVVERDGSSQTFDVKLGALPGEKEVAQNDQPSNDTDTLQGVGVEDITAQARQQFNIPENIKGAVVVDVDSNCAAYDKGVRAGDVIQEINRHSVKTAQDAVQLTQHPKDRMTLLRLWSHGNSHYVVVDETKTS